VTTKVKLIAIMLALAACAGGSEETEQTAQLSADYQGALPVQFQLLAGTFKLEDTEFAVDSGQASELLPLWKALRSLTSSDTAAEAEIEALISQIQDTMTADQIKAIAAMQLVQEDIGNLVQELDLRPELPEGFDGGDFQFPPGGFPGGAGPGGEPGPGGPGAGNFGGGLFPGGGFQDLSEEQIATRQAQRAEFGGFAGRAAGFLMQPLIQMLQEKAEL
jgi:hypothetical protein